MNLCANLSTLFGEVPLVERFALARAAGFSGVEIQFPYAFPLDDLVAAKTRAGLPVRLINVPAGDTSTGDRIKGDVGLAALASRREEFRAGVDEALEFAAALGAEKVNVLSGRPAPEEAAEAWPTLVDNLRFTAERFAAIGVRTVVEAVNPTDVPGFFLTSLGDALEALERTGHPNLGLLFDFYHMAQTDPPLPAAIARAGARIAHVQFADVPGRHQPGSGTVDFHGALQALRTAGYTGTVSAEYHPTEGTGRSLGWMTDWKEFLT